MFNLQGSEIIIILLLALVVLGPEKLPEAMRRAGKFYADIRKMSTGFQEEFRSALDEPAREMRETANLLRDSADFTKLQEGGRDEKPQSGQMATPVLPDDEDWDDDEDDDPDVEESSARTDAESESSGATDRDATDAAPTPKVVPYSLDRAAMGVPMVARDPSLDAPGDDDADDAAGEASGPTLPAPFSGNTTLGPTPPSPPPPPPPPGHAAPAGGHLPPLEGGPSPSEADDLAAPAWPAPATDREADDADETGASTE